jgi:quinol monooxygenase YgiN
MAFVQIIEMRTTRVDELTALEEEWEKATEGKRTLRRSIVTRDRNDPNRYLVLAFFDDYESAMVNSNLPETNEFGQKQAELLDGPMVFTDLDVIEDRS